MVTGNLGGGLAVGKQGAVAGQVCSIMIPVVWVGFVDVQIQMKNMNLSLEIKQDSNLLFGSL